jgi:hypothetical protein
MPGIAARAFPAVLLRLMIATATPAVTIAAVGPGRFGDQAQAQRG